MKKVSVFSLNNKFEKFEKKAEKEALKILEILRQKDVSVDVYFVGNQEARALNKRFKKKDSAANVLSFNEPSNFIYPKKAKKLGEIYININAVSEFKKSNLFSINKLLVHGILHLLGYNHQDKEKEIKMRQKEKFLISKI